MGIPVTKILQKNWTKFRRENLFKSYMGVRGRSPRENFDPFTRSITREKRQIERIWGSGSKAP